MFAMSKHRRAPSSEASSCPEMRASRSRRRRSRSARCSQSTAIRPNVLPIALALPSLASLTANGCRGAGRCQGRLAARRAACEHVFVPRGAAILHADADAFYASVEQRDDPSLRGRPVIVGAGVVLAVSYEAKAFGVRTAMGGRRARELCPHAVVVPPRMKAYSEASKAIYRVFDDTSPAVEGLSIDEAFLDVHGMEHFAGQPVEIAMRLRRRVREEVGLPVTVG